MQSLFSTGDFSDIVALSAHFNREAAMVSLYLEPVAVRHGEEHTCRAPLSDTFPKVIPVALKKLPNRRTVFHRKSRSADNLK